MNVLLLGPVPTPAVGLLTPSMRADFGIMISASHNPHHDNGIKFFGPDGFKLSDEVEEEIERLIDAGVEPAKPENIGRAKRIDDGRYRYIERVKSSFPYGMSLNGLKVVIDCAHGATYQVGPKIFNDLGAEVITIGVSPDGSNINQDCGSTNLDLLITEVRKNKADLGIAFDGDGDRVLMVSAQGQIIDGDQLLYIIVKAELISGSFQGGVVGTLMTNLAMEENLKANHVLFERSKVGDRYVSELMEERYWDYGGENSGHILLKKHHSTGDGIISALQVLKAIQQRQISFDEAVAEIELYPQILLNIATNEAVNLDAEHVQEAVKNAEKIMHDQGRVLLRKSGTEAKIRIMTECADRDLAIKAAEAIKKTIFG